jgi:hypothetical protein
MRVKRSIYECCDKNSRRKNHIPIQGVVNARPSLETPLKCFVVKKEKSSSLSGLQGTLADIVIMRGREKGRRGSAARGLSETEGSSHATPDLAAHGISALDSAGSGILVLGSATEEVVEAVGHRAPSGQLVGAGNVNHLLRLGLGSADQFAADLVGHTLELSVGARNSLLAGTKLVSADCLGLADGVGVVSCEDETNVAGEDTIVRRDRLDNVVVGAGENCLGHAVVGTVSVLDSVPDLLARLGVQVGATNELDTESETFGLGLVEVVGERCGCALEVALVGVVEDDVIGLVVNLLQVQGPGVNHGVGGGFFGRGNESDVLGRSGVANLLHGLLHDIDGLLALFEELHSVTTHTRPLQSDDVARLGSLDSLHKSLSPHLDVAGSVIGGNIGKNLASVLEDDTGVAQALQLSASGTDFGLSLTTAELLVESLSENHLQKRVALDIEDGSLGVDHGGKSLEADGQKCGLAGDGGNHVGSEDGRERKNGKSGSLVGLSDL